MNWLTEIVRPKIKKTTPKEIADNLWVRCPNCNQMLFSKELKDSHYVCTACGHHLRLYVEKRFRLLFDDEQYTLVDLPVVQDDPLKFKDIQKYSDRLKSNRKKTGCQDAIQVARGKIGSIASVVAAMDFSFMGGSMGIAVGEGIVKAAKLALKDKEPLITVTASGGARMQEGMLSLMQMARTTAAINELKEAGIPFISILLVLADFVYFYALSYEDSMISIISLVRRSGVVVSFIAGAIWFKERNLKAKFIDLLLVLAGMYLIYLGTR